MRAKETNAHPSVGVKLLDRDHEDLNEILDEIQFRITTGLGEGRTGAMVRRLAQRLQVHFALEEGMMEVSGYPDGVLHRLHHQWLMDQVEMLAAQRGRNALARNAHLMNLLVASHHRHIGHEDLHYGHWLNATRLRSADSSASAA